MAGNGLVMKGLEQSSPIMAATLGRDTDEEWSRSRGMFSMELGNVIWCVSFQLASRYSLPF